MDKLRFFIERRRILKEQFQKLKDKFLTKEQSLIVKLGELPDYYWLLYRPWSNGFTVFDVELEEDQIIGVDRTCTYICLFHQNENLKTLLCTIAHEFAHIYLVFNNPTEYRNGSPEHNRHTKIFLEYLVDNFEENNS